MSGAGGDGGERSGARLDRVEMTGNVPAAVQEAALRHQYRVAIAAFALGLIAILAGAALIAAGLSGAVSWSFSAFGVRSRLADASPGVVFCVAGVLVIALNRFDVRIRR